MFIADLNTILLVEFAAVIVISLLFVSPPALLKPIVAPMLVESPFLLNLSWLAFSCASTLSSPVTVPPARGSLAAIEFVTVVLKLASSPSAAANSFNVSSVLGALSTSASIFN